MNTVVPRGTCSWKWRRLAHTPSARRRAGTRCGALNYVQGARGCWGAKAETSGGILPLQETNRQMIPPAKVGLNRRLQDRLYSRFSNSRVVS